MISVFRVSFTLLCVLACVSPVATSPERSVSSSRQFLVYGSDIHLRGAICDLAERTKRDFLQVIGQRDEWIIPVVIHAQYPQANLPEVRRATLSLGQTGFGLKLQLDLIMASDVTQAEIRRELLGAVLLEMMYRRVPSMPAGATYFSPPDWLLDGLQTQTGSMTGALEAAVAHNVLPIEEFLRQQPNLLDAPGRSLYCAYSVALVDLLTRLPNGRLRLAHFIADLPSGSNDATVDLRGHFPELINENGAANAWFSHIVRLAAGQSHQLLSGEESERILNGILSLRVSDASSEKKYDLREFPRFIRNAPARSALARLSRVLNAFATRADPTYRPAIYEYAKVTALLARGKTRGITERLADLRTSRKRTTAQMRKIDDYLNWFEVTKSARPSGAFADYMKAAELASHPGRTRRDPISVYLDVLEIQFQD